MPRTLPVLVAALMIAGAIPGQAEVRFGRGVSIGSHDFSHQTFNRKRRAVVYLYDRAPPRHGCKWRPDGQGGRVKTCHLLRR